MNGACVKRGLIGIMLGWLVMTGWARAQEPECPELTRVRLLPRSGHAAALAGGRVTGSNEGPTTAFETLAEVNTAPGDGWTELTILNPARYRYLKFETSNGSWANLAEVEFLSGDVPITGARFGTAGSRDGARNGFDQALDGDPATYFEGAEPNGQYVGLDLGADVQAAAPRFDPAPGSQPGPIEVSMSSATSGASIRYTVGGGNPDRERGRLLEGPVRIERSTIVSAVAYTDSLAASPVVLAPYRIDAAGTVGPVVRTFHIGNSLTDTVDGWIEPVAQSGGHDLDFHRFTIPGAPTDWLWNHPGGGFGDTHYREAFFVLAPIDHLFLQPFAGHGRAIENEADYGGRFDAACREHSPGVQLWLYAQWPDQEFQDAWAQGRDSASGLGLEPAATWEQGVANHLRYIERIRDRLDADRPGPAVKIVPAGSALATIKQRVDAGEFPGIDNFFAAFFSDAVHLSPRGRYVVALVHYACLFGESPEGKVDGLTSGFNDEQLSIVQRITWDTARGYRFAGVGDGARQRDPAQP